MKRVFHPLGLALCRDETSDDFHFIFESLKLGLVRLGLEFQNKQIDLQADAADADAS